MRKAPVFYIFESRTQNMATSKKAKPTYFNAILGVALLLFMVGVLGWLLINGRALSRAFKEDLEISVDFHDNTTDANVAKLQAILNKQPFVHNTRVITKEEAAKMESQVEGTNVVDFLGYNPLFTSIAMKLHAEYVNKDSLAKIRKFIMQSNVVRDVTWSNVVVEQMNKNLNKIGIILGVISVVLLIVVIFLIDNTVRLAMFSNRFLIKTMQMVGATQSFITRPFDMRALLNGFLSGLISIVALWMLMSFATKQLPELNLLYDPGLYAALLACMMLLGIMISLVSTHRSVVKYLKLHVDDLY